MKIKSLTLDASKTIRAKFDPSKSAEKEFYKALRRVAKVSGSIVDSHADGAHIADEKEMNRQLSAYAKKIGPWAERQSKKLLDTVARSNKRAYANKSKAIGTALKLNVGEANVGAVARALQAEQVALIQSIPLEAGKRAQKIARDAFFAGTRAAPDQDTIAELQKQQGLSVEVATSRALLIARTETARANASINQARALAVGSGQYRWHNSGDGAVRESHRVYQGKRLQGRIFSWDNPPTLSDGMTGHPGTFPNCRCFAEPIFDD